MIFQINIFSGLPTFFLAWLLRLCLFICLLYSTSYAQDTANNLHQWGGVGSFHGLPSDKVRAIAQDADGVLWFGTENGLAKFDGRRVQTVQIDGFNNAKIFALKTTSDNSLWIATEKGAILRQHEKFQPIAETLDKSIVSIVEATNNRIVLTSENGEIFDCRIEGENLWVAATDLLADARREKPDLSSVTSLSVNDATILLGTRGRSLIKIENNAANELFSRPRPFFINALAKDLSGNLWIGAKADDNSSGLFFAKDVSRPAKIGVNLGEVTAISFAPNSEIWVGTEKRGVFRFKNFEQIENFTFENTAGGLRSNRIFAVFVDREGVVWFGTDKGVCRYDAKSPHTLVFSEEGNSNFVRTIFQAGDGKIFAGTNRGLFVFGNGVWQADANFAAKVVYIIRDSVVNERLVGTANGLFGASNTVKIAGDIRGIENFGGKTYIAVFGRGLVELESQNVIFAGETITSLYADGAKLFIGTAKDGVFSFDGKQITPENSLEKLRGAAIREMTGNFEKGLFIGTERGLYLYQNQTLTTLLENTEVRAAVVNEAQNEVWSATNSGVFCLKFDEKIGWLKSNLNIEQGLPSANTFALLPTKNADGEEILLIGTNRGIVNYTPNKSAPLIIPTRILSQRLHQNSEIAGEIRLEYPQNTLTVEVAALSNRTFPEKFQYAFWLRDKAGNILKQKISSDAQFSAEDLRPGNYEIEVRAFNQDLLASEPLKIKFAIAKAPFPLTSVLLTVLLIIALIALVWALLNRRRMTRTNRELVAARLDLANEAERERRRIARDLHDQTLADLRSLALKSDKPTLLDASFRREIEDVSNEIRRICEDLSPSVLENVGLAASLEWLLSQTATNYKFLCPEDLEENLTFSRSEQMQIYRIAQEVLSNIKRHAEASEIKMQISKTVENTFRLEIENDGREFLPDFQNLPKGRGLANIKSRANLINAEIAWETFDNDKTRFVLQKR